MTIKEEESKKPLFQRIRETVSKKWENLSDKNKTIIGIVIIILLGCLACSPILVFSSIDFFAAMPLIYKMLAFLVLSGLFLYYYFKWTFKYISVLSKTLETFYGWEDGIAVLLLIYGIYSFLMQPTVGFLIEFRAELLGAGIATLLIGNASQAAQIQEEKKRLILQMGSPDNSFAIEAIRQLDEQGWLEDGSLKWARLSLANVSGADLPWAVLSGAYLAGANLSEAKLWWADLSGAYLEGANLSGADLGGANLNRADLGGANLRGANLEESNLSGAWLTMANLSGANMEDANLSHANLEGADLNGVKLWGAKLWIVNLSGADLQKAKLSETTDWRDVFYTEGENGTVFPEGFNPEDHRMHLIRGNESIQKAYKRVFPDIR